MEQQANFVDHWTPFLNSLQSLNPKIDTCGWNSAHVTSNVVGNPTMWLEIQPAAIEWKINVVSFFLFQ